MDKTAEIVRALRECGEGKSACSKCLWEKYTGAECHFAQAHDAADVIERLQAHLARVTAEREDYREKHETLMRRHSKQVEVIRRRIDAGDLTAEEKRLLNDLEFETRYDVRGPQEAGKGEAE